MPDTNTTNTKITTENVGGNESWTNNQGALVFLVVLSLLLVVAVIVFQGPRLHRAWLLLKSRLTKREVMVLGERSSPASPITSTPVNWGRASKQPVGPKGGNAAVVQFITPSSTLIEGSSELAHSTMDRRNAPPCCTVTIISSAYPPPPSPSPLNCRPNQSQPSSSSRSAPDSNSHNQIERQSLSLLSVPSRMSGSPRTDYADVRIVPDMPPPAYQA